jgi:hypothetical protein
MALYRGQLGVRKSKAGRYWTGLVVYAAHCVLNSMAKWSVRNSGMHRVEQSVVRCVCEGSCSKVTR